MPRVDAMRQNIRPKPAPPPPPPERSPKLAAVLQELEEVNDPALGARERFTLESLLESMIHSLTADQLRTLAALRSWPTKPGMTL